MPSSSIRGRINRKSLVVKTQDPTNVIDNELVSSRRYEYHKLLELLSVLRFISDIIQFSVLYDNR